LVGPTADDIDDKTDTSTHQDVLEDVLAEGRSLMPDLDEKYVIKTYAGNRPHSEDGIYRVKPSECASNVIQTVAIRSLGVGASPALADYVFDLLVEQGLHAPIQQKARDRLDRPRSLFETLDCECAANDPLGRTIVCACEKVTAAEIHAALQSPLPARSMSGIARRTHATYGRCQGSACGAGVALIASLYLEGEAWEVPVGEPEAMLGVGRAHHV
jgi:glycerol-3-phosphate dehydrogenase